MAVMSRAKQCGRDLTARAIARLLCRLAHDPKYFELWQSHGFHVLPSDYYQPIPDTGVLPLSLWNRVSDLPCVDMRDEYQSNCLRKSHIKHPDLLTKAFPSYKPGVLPASFWFRRTR